MTFSSDLFLSNRLVDADTFRNIVSLRESANLFDELSDDPHDQAVAIQAELETKNDIHPSTPAPIYKGFAYHTAIAYPFLAEPFLDTRFGDGSYGVWYGSMALITTIHETAYHMYRAIVSVEDHPNIVKQERAVYTVHCQGILIDLSQKTGEHPDLVSNVGNVLLY
ncbi:MAG: RES family NAD+ phosphorylase [Desulfosarcina sp.]